jgi:hypothetical protein
MNVASFSCSQQARLLALAAGGVVMLASLGAHAEPLGPAFEDAPMQTQPASPAAKSASPDVAGDTTVEAAGDRDADSIKAESAKKPLAQARSTAAEAMPLGQGSAPKIAAPAGAKDDKKSTATSGIESLGISRTVIALAGVVGLAFVVSAAVKVAARKRGGVALAMGPAGRAPSGVVMVLARYPVQRGQILVLLKVGPRVLLTCQSKPSRFTAASMTTLAEFTDPDQVAELVRLTSLHGGEAAAAHAGGFDAILRQVGLAKPEAAEKVAGRRHVVEEPMRMQPRQEQRIMTAESGDRAEISRRADLLNRRSPTGFGSVPSSSTQAPAATQAVRPEPRRHSTANGGGHVDGAEQLRRRLANLRGGMGEQG